MTFGVGVIGATGFVASSYRAEIRASPQDAKIVALCARRRELLEAAGSEDGAVLLTDDWRQVVEHPDVDFVVVAVPDALHHEMVMACARHGKHVLCEKPVAANAQQAHEMWTAYRAAGLGHFVPYWSRYVPVFVRAREIVRQGLLGEIKAVVYRWHNPRPVAMPFTWRDDASLSAAGSIADVGSHAYDTTRWLLGLEAARVLAHASILSPPKPDLGAVNLREALQWGQSHDAHDNPSLRRGTAFDYGQIAFEFENGAVASMMLSHAPFLRKGLAPEVELHGTEASLAVDRASGTLTLARPDEEAGRGIAARQEARTLDTVPNPGSGNRFARHVFPALRARETGATSDHPDLEDGWRVQLFTDAATLSAHRGGWVELAELKAERSVT